MLLCGHPVLFFGRWRSGGYERHFIFPLIVFSLFFFLLFVFLLFALPTLIFPFLVCRFWAPGILSVAFRRIRLRSFWLRRFGWAAQTLFGDRFDSRRQRQCRVGRACRV